MKNKNEIKPTQTENNEFNKLSSKTDFPLSIIRRNTSKGRKVATFKVYF